MKLFKTLCGVLLLGVVTVAWAGSALAQPRIPELIDEAGYGNAWLQMVENEVHLPEWVANLRGPSTPTQTINVDGQQYLVGEVCQQHNCFNQRLYVAFTVDKTHAYALYVQVPDDLPNDLAPSMNATQRWLGNPDAQVQEILLTQLQADPNWN